MALGGNQRARQFFKQHGWDEVGSDKIEGKYTSRAAQLYRAMLEKEAGKTTAEAALQTAISGGYVWARAHGCHCLRELTMSLACTMCGLDACGNVGLLQKRAWRA
jgi:hypothetical protein